MRVMADRFRAFVAIRMNATTESAIASFVQELRETDAAVAWVRRANLHLTLRFLGDAVPAAMLEALDLALQRIGANTAPFRVKASGTGAFPNLERPRVLWIGLRGEPMIELAGRIETAVRECGFAPEPRSFTPHLTIGRLRHLRGWRPVRELLAGHADQEFGESLIDAMTLYRSVLGAGEPIYEALARYSFPSA